MNGDPQDRENSGGTSDFDSRDVGIIEMDTDEGKVDHTVRPLRDSIRKALGLPLQGQDEKQKPD
jgi:hypothetical protein